LFNHASFHATLFSLILNAGEYPAGQGDSVVGARVLHYNQAASSISIR
jgi:hypothetical protein